MSDETAAASPDEEPMAFSTLAVHRRGPVGWLIFDRPQRGNAMDATMLRELPEAWRQLDEDPAIRAIVVTGTGRDFQTGLDVVQLSRDPEALREQSRHTRRGELPFTPRHAGVLTPVIAAVNGTCAGGGLHFVADADVCIASADASFVDPHVSVGQVSAFEAIGLARRISFEPVMRLVLTGRHERMSAARAHQLGMISQVVDVRDSLREVAQALGEKIARNSPTAVAVSKQALWRALEFGLTEACRAGALDVVGMWGHPDQTEGYAASAERREALFVSRLFVSPLGSPPAQPPPDDRAPEPSGPGEADHEQPQTRATRGSQLDPYPVFETLLLERRGPVGWLINNRPEQLNAMNNTMRDEFAEAWLVLERDPKVRVIVHTGEGRAFQTGVDVAEIASDGIGMERYRRSMEEFDIHFTAWHQGVTKPVITAVNGLCAGGAFHWVADADVCIAASDAQFFDPHVSVGQVVSIEAIGLLRKMPFEAVMRMAMVGRHERMSAERAYELGMISQVVDPPERLRDEAQALAEKIARNSPVAMAASKRALWRALELGLTDACREGAKDLVSVWGHPDQTEGPAAFAERREPRWADPT